jgi:hypothetical protein
MPFPELICPGCGFSFIPKRAEQESCSVQCRNAVTARKSARSRGEQLRARGQGKARDAKLMGRKRHRVLAEEFLGRSLPSSQPVHHLDGDHSNDSPYNLMPMSSQSAHIRLGHRKAKRA